MSQAGITGLRATSEDVLLVLDSLDEEEWGRPSGARGWSVKDVAIHLEDLLETLTTAVAGTLHTSLGIEALNEENVARKRDRSSRQVVDEFRAQMARALPVFESLQAEPIASTPVPFLDLGTYPLHNMPDVCAFDFFAHLRTDLLAPTGPLLRSVPDGDDVRMRPAVGWLLNGISQMQPDLPGYIEAPMTLMLTGPGGGTWRITREAEGATVRPVELEDGHGAVEMCSTTSEFMSWATTRTRWREHVKVSGDQSVAETFLDHLNLI